MAAAPWLRDGVGASTLTLQAGDGATTLDQLLARFPDIAEHEWRSRFERGLVVDDAGHAVTATQAARPGTRLHYWRELPPEPVIPFDFEILHRDAQLLVIDKPHFLPVIPAGRFVQQSLLVRLRRELGLADLAPLHRLDRGTAGVVLFSIDPASRGRYQALFAQRRVEKVYEALAPACPGLALPLTRRSRIVAGEPFFRMREAEGAPNAETHVDVIDTRPDGTRRYRLRPVSGRKHQLRVHMAALGAPIHNDPLYPELQAPAAETDFSRPLKLLARALSFSDPLSGEPRHFRSTREL